MSSRTPKPSEAADTDEDDDPVDTIVIPSHWKQEQPSGSHIKSVHQQPALEHFFPKRHHQHSLQTGQETPSNHQQQKPASAPIAAPAGSPLFNRKKRRAQSTSIDIDTASDGDIYSSNDETRARSAHRVLQQDIGVPAADEPFSKKNFLRRFEGSGESQETETDSHRGEYRGREPSDDEIEDYAWNGAGQEELEMDEDRLTTPASLDNHNLKRCQSPRRASPAMDVDENDPASSSEEIEDDDDGIGTPTGPLHGHNMSIDLTPKRSMATPHSPEKFTKKLLEEEQHVKEQVLKEVSTKNAEARALRNFDIIVKIPTYEEVADYLINPDEWKAVAIESRWTAEDGHASYKLIYRDGHTDTVDANIILNHIDPQILEDFENDLFAREENPETFYYPNFKAPGGVFAGGTGITSGEVKRQGRRSNNKIFLDKCYRLGMPEELNIPMSDSSESDSEEESAAPAANSQITASQYDKFEITDQDILASIRENSSDNESWSGRKKSTRGRPRGRGATVSTRGAPSKRGRPSGRGSNVVRTSQVARDERKPRLVPSRGQSSLRPSRGSNVVKASATSRGRARGRPRGPRTHITTDASGNERSSPVPRPVVPERKPGTRGRPRGSKNLLKPLSSSRPVTPLSETGSQMSPAQQQQQQHTLLQSQPQSPPLLQIPVSKPQPLSHRRLKPTRVPKPPRTPSGARGPGRPPKPRSKDEEDLVKETIRTAGGNIPSMATVPEPLRISTERPKKRRRVLPHDEPLENPNAALSPPRPSSSSHRHHSNDNHHHHPNHQHGHSHHLKHEQPKGRDTHPDSNKKQNLPGSSLAIDQILGRHSMSGTPAYCVRLHGQSIGEFMWVFFEDLDSESRQKIKAYEAMLKDEALRKSEYRDSLNAQLQLESDKKRVAEREAQILGKHARKCSGHTNGAAAREEVDAETLRREREREDQRHRERVARRLAMQETLFAGT
ncbi:hypothetical protein DRE_01265 [Drechslerella stenobrocha 248]|uniref:Uncharacterized protein n=1 Tax=Drechslerella stenobrocha 248 TaxID=1043628 RepID=W7HVH8_9PEZI|nr:hypothetical protein DRE_01265 [Drechslerella stenobrocha 248]